MYICNACAEEYELDTSFTCISACEICGNLKGDWQTHHCGWAREIVRPIGEKNPKKYVTDQLEEWKEILARERAEKS